MYLHDYSYSVNDTINCFYDEHTYEECQTGWLNIQQNDSILDEWLISRTGWSNWDKAFVSFIIDSVGAFDLRVTDQNTHIRPVFYINASEELLSGTGTITDPFIIKS